MSQEGILNIAGGGGGGSPILTLTGNSGGPVPPTANNVNVVGDGTTITIAGNPGTSTLTASLIQSGVTYYSLTPYIVGSDVHSQYTTITAAITAGTLAGVPFNVYVKPGTYAESITPVAGCNIIALNFPNTSNLNSDDLPGNVVVTGGITYAGAGLCTIQGIDFTPSTTAITMTSGAVTNRLYFNQCVIKPASGFNIFNITNDNAYVQFDNSQVSQNSGAHLGTVNASGSIIEFTNGSSFLLNEDSTITNGNLLIYDSLVYGLADTLTITTGTLTAYNSTLTRTVLGTGVTTCFVVGNTFNSTVSDAWLVYNSTTSGVLFVNNNVFENYSINQSPIQGTSTKQVQASNNAAPIYSATVQNPIISSTLISGLTAYSVLNSGGLRHDSLHAAMNFPAGDYTVVPNDYFIGADTTAARAITLPAAPTIGRTLRIKDVTGTANTHNITIGGNGKNIDGSASYVINANYGSIDLIYSGTAWFVV